MYVKKLKRICMVKGCKNIDTYAISAIAGYGDTIIVCEKCLRAALDAIEHYDEPKPEPKKPNPKPMFYNHLTVNTPPNTEDGDKKDELMAKLRKAIDDGVKEGLEKSGITITDDTGGKEDSSDAPQNPEGEAVPVNADTPTQENSENPPAEPQYICEKCGKVCSSQSGLTSHKKVCDTK